LALSAIRDRAAAIDATEFERYTRRFLVNPDEAPYSERRHRLVSTDADRIAFSKFVDNPDAADREGAVGSTYRFFFDRVAGTDREGEPIDLDRLTKAITNRLTLVDITTGPQDNTHRIFESLNATGVSLTQADLLRNYVFMVLGDRADHVYEETWRPMERYLGLVHLEGLARVDLQRRGQEVTHDRIYFTQRSRLDKVAHDLDAIEDEVKDLALRVRHYKRLLDPTAETERDPVVRRHLLFLRRWGATTSYPLLMHVYDAYHRGACTVEQLRRIVAYVESFIVRRHLAAVPTNFLNKLFITAIDRLPDNLPIDEAVHQTLSAPRSYWASDERLRSAIHTNPFYLTGRGHQRKLILERLEESFEHPEPVDLEVAKLTIEHIMPQTLSKDWREALSEAGEVPEQVRDDLGHTLGNLTLTAWNETLSNHPFERKQQIFGESNLALNSWLLQTQAWGRAEIAERADRLADQAIRIWPGPVPGVGDEESADGFDWSAIDAAIEAIPAGNWTSYGDLAEFGGTAAQPVGNYCASRSAPAHAYRVLTSGGQVSAYFRWTDSSETRSVSAVLEEEGIRFNEQGAADQSQRLRAPDLQGLIDEEAGAA
jgi:alkylated DNA nucleotide flippase Atl1